MQELEKIAKQIRLRTLKMLFKAGSGHLASSMSVIEILTALYFGKILKYQPQKPNWEGRDYFLLSNGHACPAFYAVLAKAGYFPEDKLENGLFQLGTGLQGHPVKKSLPGIEISSGSLGMGLSVAIGIALGLRLKNKKNQVIVMMSDGEQQEGSTWEAVMAGAHFQLGRLIAVIDRNGIQIAGKTEENMKLKSLKDKYRSFGWKTITINGHNFRQILKAFKKAERSKKPTVIISNTIPAKGVWSWEGRDDSHHPYLSEKTYQRSLKETR